MKGKRALRKKHKLHLKVFCSILTLFKISNKRNDLCIENVSCIQRLGRDSGIYTPLNETMETLIPVNFYYMLINAFCPWFLQLKRNEKMLSFEWKGWEMHLLVTTYKSNEVFCVIFTSTSLHKCLFLLCSVKQRLKLGPHLTPN